MAEEPYDDLDIGYVEWPMPTTEEFTVIRFLNKTGVARLWQKIKDKFIHKPEGGVAGQVLAKTDTGFEWKDVDIDSVDINIATSEVAGIVKIGTGLKISSDGILTPDFPTNEELIDELNL